ncbi:hypothetical protein [Pseudobacillus badius]|uniref:hypothetical protein n=1 Tax=Bacillus badius TaxID=1455 RepID=UPI0024A0DB41|nr:hypothetical protein [Bacillus badius]GLY12198.1 hypothetical protein Bbad01_34140 [Bacillus badius]
MVNAIKTTDYCVLFNQGKVTTGDSVYAIEKILVRKKGTTEIRFAYYKKDSNGKENFVPRPLDLEEEHLVSLLKEGIKSEVISKEMLQKVIDES